MTIEHTSQGESPSSQPASQPQPAVSQPSNNFAVPETYKDRGWVEKIKSPDDLWKTLDNAQSLLGKRPAGIPSPDASDADWDSFYKHMGRPDEAKYDLKDPEGLPEGFDTAGYKQTASEILHAAGLTPRQAERVYQEYLKRELVGAGKAQEETAEREKQLDAEFDGLTKEHFGENYTDAEKAAFDAVGRYAPQSLKEAFKEISDKPKALVAMIATINGLKGELDKVKAEYGAEGNLNSGDPSPGVSIDDTRNELANLRVSKEARDFLHADHKKTMERINSLSATVNRYYKK